MVHRQTDQPTACVAEYGIPLYPYQAEKPAFPCGPVGSVLARLENYQTTHPRMRNVSRELGALLHETALGMTSGSIVEVGGSNGYAALWLGLAAEARGLKVTTIEKYDWKASMARDAIRQAGLQAIVEVVTGAAEDVLPSIEVPVSMLFMDIWPSDYLNLALRALPDMLAGSVLIADNILSHRDRNGRRHPSGSEAEDFLHFVGGHSFSDQRILTVGEGVLMARVAVQ